MKFKKCLPRMAKMAMGPKNGTLISQQMCCPNYSMKWNYQEKLRMHNLIFYNMWHENEKHILTRD